MLKLLVPLLSAVLISVGQVEADSDGYFCSADGYLVFDQIGSDGSRIFKFAFFSDSGVSEPHEISMTYFQTHGLRCETDRVVVAGWEDSYLIDLSDRNAISWEKMKGSTRSRSKNLGLWAEEGEHTYRLDAGGTNHSFTLFVTKEHRAIPGGEDIRVVSKLVHKDPHGKVVSTTVLLDQEEQRGIH